MSDNDSAVEKRIVNRLDFDAKTAKRVGWELFEFTIVGPHQVKVVNASYGFEKEAHAYVVGIEKRDGDPVPAECECPADLHREPDCKHKVALATVGGPTVLNAALEFSGRGPAPFRVENAEDVTTAADKLQTDGGMDADMTAETAASEPSDRDGPRYTYHREPARAGGARFVRCEECGTECVPANPDRLYHRDGCSEASR